MNKLITIEANGFASQTKIYDENGTPIENVSQVDFAPIVPGGLVSACLTFVPSRIVGKVNAFLSLPTLHEAAADYGMKLVPIDTEIKLVPMKGDVTTEQKVTTIGSEYEQFVATQSN